MKLDYLQYLELEVFTRFGAKLDSAMEHNIKRGRLLREILKQDRLEPLPIAFQLAWLVAFNEGMLDEVDTSAVAAALNRLQDGLETAPLSMDEPRNQWVQAVSAWLGDNS